MKARGFRHATAPGAGTLRAAPYPDREARR
jgi:hypothetical protein